MTTIHVEYKVPSAVRPSARVLEIAAMFGLGLDDQRDVTIIPSRTIEIPIEKGGIIFVTGSSGGGKSTLLRIIAAACQDQNLKVLRFDELPKLKDESLVDVFDLPFDQTMAILAQVGLGDAFVMLRRPCELSDGQYHRLKLAQLLHIVGQSEAPAIVLADEFGATLDRLTATIIAAAVRRWVRRTGCTFICATTHDDLLEALEPETLIWVGPGGSMEVLSR